MRMRRLVFVGGALAVVALLLPHMAWASGQEEAARFQAELEQSGLLWMYLTCFGFGVLASLTPCVYPMIPIVVGVFGARDDAVTRRRAFALATAYVLGLGVVFSALGLTFALIGEAGDQGEVLANPWIVWPIVAVYAVLAASMFGAFELQLPSGLQQRLARVGGKGYGGAFAMGMVGGFTAAPCTGPFLAGLLAWVAVKGNPLVGGTMLFSFALGMGVLFWIIAATSVSLPKSGRWMEWVKSLGGISLIVVGIYFLRPIIPALDNIEVKSQWIALACLGAAVLGVVIGAVHLSFHGRAAERLRKAAGVVLVSAGAAGIMFWIMTAERKLPWRTDEAVAFAEARSQEKGVHPRLLGHLVQAVRQARDRHLRQEAGLREDHGRLRPAQVRRHPRHRRGRGQAGEVRPVDHAGGHPARRQRARPRPDPRLRRPRRVHGQAPTGRPGPSPITDRGKVSTAKT